jgi:hypothetical protein
MLRSMVAWSTRNLAFNIRVLKSAYHVMCLNLVELLAWAVLRENTMARYGRNKSTLKSSLRSRYVPLLVNQFIMGILIFEGTIPYIAITGNLKEFESLQPPHSWRRNFVVDLLNYKNINFDHIRFAS